jgi:hypothetical protein
MRHFRESYDLDFCVVFLPAPLIAKGNRNVKKTPYGFKDSCTLANYSMAVNIADQSKFGEYHEYLMKGNHPPSTDKARTKAEELVGKKKFEEALKDPRIKQWIGTATGVQSFIKAKTIPRLITHKHVVSYSGGSKAGFAKLIKNALDLKEIKKKTQH